ncbi:hypothetical protein HMPREF1436_00075 [Helicobacter pylori GAMchJs136i]|nr:hypothetical protein HMPREF1436_00075 [Helicobacter pylori GAMchJs136i]
MGFRKTTFNSTQYPSMSLKLLTRIAKNKFLLQIFGIRRDIKPLHKKD